MPLPPRAVVVTTNWDEDAASETVNIQWKKPLDDGGWPIINYHVEGKAVGKENWQKCRKRNRRLKLMTIGDNHATVAEVPILEEYQFRVIAVYNTGQSFANEPTNYYDEHTFSKSIIRY